MLLDNIKPKIIEISKALIDYYKQATAQKISVQQEFTDFRRKNKQYFDHNLIKREELYYKYARNEHFLNLYNDYMQEEPLYVPRKFHLDTYHVTSQAELHIIIKADFNRFQTECEIFKLRCNDLSNKMFQIDEEIEKYINGTQLSPEAKEKLQNRWNECINEDKRKLKIISTQKAASKDKEFYKNHQLTRLPGQPKCTPSINSTKSNVINDKGNNQLITEINQQEPEQSKNELIPVSPERNKYILRSSKYQEKF